MITGAGGFLGSQLVKRLNTEKNYDLFTDRIDLLDPRELKSAINEIKPDVVFHLASYVNLSRDFLTAKKCIDANINGTLNLLEALRNCPPSKFIFTSTEEVYNGASIPFSENQTLDPPSPYSVSKIASEYLCKLYTKELDFSLIIFRLATFYGPENPTHRLIPQIIINALNNNDILLNSGEKKRDYLYVNDAVDALEKAIKKTQKEKIEIINLGGGKLYTLRDLVNKVMAITNSKSKIIYDAYPDRVMEADEWLLDIKKAEKILGWKPKTTLDEGLQNTIAYFKANYL